MNTTRGSSSFSGPSLFGDVEPVAVRVRDTDRSARPHRSPPPNRRRRARARSACRSLPRAGTGSRPGQLKRTRIGRLVATARSRAVCNSRSTSARLRVHAHVREHSSRIVGTAIAATIAITAIDEDQLDERKTTSAARGGSGRRDRGGCRHGPTRSVAHRRGNAAATAAERGTTAPTHLSTLGWRQNRRLRPGGAAPGAIPDLLPSVTNVEATVPVGSVTSSAAPPAGDAPATTAVVGHDDLLHEREPEAGAVAPCVVKNGRKMPVADRPVDPRPVVADVIAHRRGGRRRRSPSIDDRAAPPAAPAHASSALRTRLLNACRSRTSSPSIVRELAAHGDVAAGGARRRRGCRRRARRRSRAGPPAPASAARAARS